MEFNNLLNRSIFGFLILFTVLVCFYFNLDIQLYVIICAISFYEIYKNKIINNIFFIFILFSFILLIFILSFFDLSYFIVFFSLLFLSLSILHKNYLPYYFVFFHLFFLSTIFLLLNDRVFYLVIFFSFFNDTLAYFFGNLIKGPKISIKLSPNKTWSGTLSSFILTFIFLILFSFNFIDALIISLLFYFGDIYFSFIKRKLLIKDFSSLLHSHGGLMDRLDSISLPSIYILCTSLIS